MQCASCRQEMRLGILGLQKGNIIMVPETVNSNPKLIGEYMANTAYMVTQGWTEITLCLDREQCQRKRELN